MWFPLALLITSAIAATRPTTLPYEPPPFKTNIDPEVLAKLPDFSKAGYRRGEKELPTVEADVSVTEFGALPDDEVDDTEAFKAAIEQAAGKTIGIPAGRFVLSDRLLIDTSGTVLQGAGAGETILLFTRSLEEIEPRASQTGHGTTTTAWSWGGGLIQIGTGGAMMSGPRARPTEISAVGQATLTLEDHSFEVGDELLIEQRNPEDNSLAAYLYNGELRDRDTDIAGIRVSQVATVLAADEQGVTLDRPLRFEVRPEWATLARFQPSVTESGVEGLTIQFPAGPYRGHFNEDGWNAFNLAGAGHCWIRDVEIVDCDSGGFIGGHFNTVDGIVLRTSREADGGNHTGHHGFYVRGGDNLITHFDVQTRFIHDLSVGAGSVGTVWSQGRGLDLAMDHHRLAPYRNLYSDIDVGAGRRYFASGGTGTRGKHTATGATFWNIRGKAPARLPGDDFAPVGVFFIAVKGLEPENAPEGWVIVSPDEPVVPADLHAAQRDAARGG